MSSLSLIGEVAVDAVAFDGTAETTEEVVRRLQFVLWRLEAQQDWERGALFESLKQLAEPLELKPRSYLRLCLSRCSGKSSAYSLPFHVDSA